MLPAALMLTHGFTFKEAQIKWSSLPELRFEVRLRADGPLLHGRLWGVERFSDATIAKRDAEGPRCSNVLDCFALVVAWPCEVLHPCAVTVHGFDPDGTIILDLNSSYGSSRSLAKEGVKVGYFKARVGDPGTDELQHFASEARQRRSGFWYYESIPPERA